MRIDVTFIGIGLIVLLLGMSFGAWMGATDNFQYADLHAHLNLLGFVLPTLFGLLHRTYPGLVRSRLAWPHLVAHFTGVLIFIPGLYIVVTTNNALIVSVGASVVILSALTLAYIFFSADKSEAARS